MNRYNTEIIPRINSYIESLIERINYSLKEGDYNKIERFEVIDSDNLDINYLRMNGSTGFMTIKYHFLTVKDGTEDRYDLDLEIPKLINNTFVIDGSLRIPTNTLDRDDSCTTYNDNIVINDSIDIKFVWDETQPGGYKLTLHIWEDEEPIIIDGSDENFHNYRDSLKLSKYEINKLKVKLDLDQIPEYLDRDTVLKLIDKGPDKMYDSLIDKKVYSTESNFMKYLNGRDVRPGVIKGMKKKFYQYNRIYLRDIQNAIDRYFKIANEKNIDIPSTVNPLVFDAMQYKVVIPKNVAYNDSMVDAIDIVNTPINGNVNKINELNVCAEIIGDEIHIKCYTFPDQKPVTVPYTEYCTKKVLINQFWDYEDRKFLQREVKYKLRLKYYEGTSDDTYDLIEPKPDEKLSITTRRLPLINSSDSIRLSMSTSMLKQALELVHSEPSLITAGHDDEDFEKSTLITRHSGPPATVELIKDNKVFLRNPEGSTYFVDIPEPTIGINDSIISFEPTVKTGQKVTEGDVLVVPKMLKNKSFELGINSKVIYMNYLGYTHEDGIVISESYAKRLTHFSILNVVKELYPDDIIRFIKKKGSKVVSKDILVNDQTRLRVTSNLSDMYNGGLLRGLGITYNQSNLLTPNNVDEGYVIDVKIELRPEAKFTHKETNEILSRYEKEPNSSDYDWLPQKYKDLKADSHLMSNRAAGYISVKILRVNKAKIGDKLVNNYGSKGVVSLLLPDECMPQIEVKGVRTPSEILLNPAAVIKRKNLSQLYETSLTKCVKEIYKRISEMINSGEVAKAKEFTKKYYGKKFTRMKDDEFYEYFKSTDIFGFRLETGSFSRISYEEMVEWMKELGVDDTDLIYCPDVIIVETKDGLRGYPPKGYVRSPGDKPKLYELGYVEGRSVTGDAYIKKLSHSADYTGKVTSSVIESEESLLGRGNYRFDGGQKIGEMELWILLETGTEQFLMDHSESLRLNQYRFLNELLLAGYTILDKDNIPMLSNQHSKLQRLKELAEK